MKDEPRWVSKTAVLALHEAMLAEHGGAAGLLDEGRPDAALAGPRNQFAYGRVDVWSLAAAYAHAITRDHPFHDGNKRVALTVAGVFLELNGFRLEASEQDAVGAIVALSSRKLDEARFAAWLKDASRKIPGRRRKRAAHAAPRRRRSRTRGR